MNNSDHSKLMADGYTIVRADYYNLTIKEKTASHGWRILVGPFKTVKALKKELGDYRLVDKLVQD